jgi:hypothetical protein
MRLLGIRFLRKLYQREVISKVTADLHRCVAWSTGVSLKASPLFERDEWQAAYIVARKPIPKQPPSLNTVVRLIASFGSFLGCKGDGEPGVKTIWTRLQRVMDFAARIRAYKAGEICV